MRGTWLGFTCLAAALFAACSGGDEPDGGGNNNITCAITADCSGGLVCVVDTCRAPGSVGASGACSATRDCGGGLYCAATEGKCRSAGTSNQGAGCATDEDCVAGLRCDSTGVAGVCAAAGLRDVGDSCAATSECLAGLYCGAARACQSFAKAFTPLDTLTCAADSGPFKSYFEVPRAGFPKDFFRLPYPNDIRVAAAAPRLNLTDFPRAGVGFLGVDVVDLYADTLVEDFDGFSPVGQVAFHFSAELDFAFLVANKLDAIRFVDLTSGEPVLAFSFSYGIPKTRFSCPNILSVSPASTVAPLAAGHTFAVVLTTAGIRQKSGAAPAQDADLAAMLGAARPTDAALAKAWDDYAKLRAWLPTENIPVAQVVNAAVFTVSDPTATMRKLAVAAAAAPPPVLSSLFQCGTAGTDACDDGSAARKCGADSPDFVEIHGKIKLPIFQSGTAPYLKPADGGAIAATPSKVRDEEVCFALTLPKGTAPAAGWPLVVYGHGTGGSFRSFISDGIAAQLAKASTPMAVFSIDAVNHGARRGGSTLSPELLVFNVGNPRAARDNLLQGAADVLTTLRVPSATVSGSWTGPQLKFPAKVAYFGHSQGATQGSLALPFSDSAGAAVMSGAGANLTAGLMGKTSPSSSADALAFLLLEPVDAAHPVVTLLQQLFDRADPANSDALLVRAPPAGRAAKHLLMTWGKGDTYTPHDALEWNVLVSGLLGTTPIIDELGNQPELKSRPLTKTVGDTTAVFIQYPPSGYDGHFVAWRNADAVRDVNAFLTSFFTTGTPTIP